MFSITVLIIYCICNRLYDCTDPFVISVALVIFFFFSLPLTGSVLDITRPMQLTKVAGSTSMTAPSHWPMKTPSWRQRPTSFSTWNARPELDQINFNSSFKSLFVNYTGQTFPIFHKYLIQDLISLCTFQFPILGLVLSMVVTYGHRLICFFSSTRKPQQIFWFAALVVIIQFLYVVSRT